MALDEALLYWHSQKIPPVIRFYGWNPATLSVGYFQNIKKEINFDAVHKHYSGLSEDRQADGVFCMIKN